IKNVLRNKRRTILTVFSLAASIFIVTTLLNVLQGIEHTAQGDEGALRLITRHKVALILPLPESYWEKMKQIPHVTGVTPASWYQGVYIDDSFNNWFARFAVDPQSYLEMYKEERPIDPEQAKAWIADRRGAIAGKALFDKYKWKIGDVVPIKGDIYPVNLEL